MDSLEPTGSLLPLVQGNLHVNMALWGSLFQTPTPSRCSQERDRFQLEELWSCQEIKAEFSVQLGCKELGETSSNLSIEVVKVKSSVK